MVVVKANIAQREKKLIKCSKDNANMLMLHEMSGNHQRYYSSSWHECANFMLTQPTELSLGFIRWAPQMVQVSMAIHQIVVRAISGWTNRQVDITILLSYNKCYS